MRWWYVLLGLLDLYLLATLAPAVALPLVQWLALRSGPYLEAEGTLLARLLAALEAHAARQPLAPRPGRYGEIDAPAGRALSELHSVLASASQLFTGLESYRPTPLSLVQVLRFGAWRPLASALNAARRRRLLRRELNRASSLAGELDELSRQLDAIPGRARAALSEMRAEANRIATLLEAEYEMGTQGLAELGEPLKATSAKVERGLDLLSSAQETRLPQVVLVIDGALAEISPEIESLDRRLTQIARHREGASSALARIDSALRAAAERWRGLQELGATEPDIQRHSALLQIGVDKAKRLAATRTPEAYKQIVDDVPALDAQLAQLEDALAKTGDLIEQSRAAIEGDLRALAEAQQACDQVRRAEPLLEPDVSQALIEAASEAYVQAERLRGLGTQEGFERSLDLSRQASTYLQQALDGLAPLLDQTKRVHQLLKELGPRTLSHWHSRADRLQHELQVYARHWDAGLGARVGAVLAQLEQIEVNLERMPPNVRYLRRFRQSELREGLDILDEAHSSLQAAIQEIVNLEGELDRIEARREQAEQMLASLHGRTLPALLALRDRMLPELAERLDEVSSSLGRQVASLSEPAQADYDEAVDGLLPSIAGELEQIGRAHEEHVQRYGDQARDARADLERLWRRLRRLDPEQAPGPSLDVQALADDWAAWRRDAQRWAESPARLHELVGQRAQILAQRMDQAHTEIAEGRRARESLIRQYDQHMDALRGVRQRVQDLRHTGGWPLLDWETRGARAAWEQSLALERESRALPTLEQAIDHLRKAIQAIERAEQEYQDIESRMRTGLRRLDRDLRSVALGLERGRREIQALESDGDLEAAAALRIRCDQVDRAVERAQAAGTFEEVVRHLREASDLLAHL